MGYYPSKIACLLNITGTLEYGMIDCLVGGQVLSAIADGRMAVVVGIVNIAVLTWVVVLFGMRLFHIRGDGHGSPRSLLSSFWSAVRVPSLTPQ
jgi:purine-cytosine permease-like protein